MASGETQTTYSVADLLRHRSWVRSLARRLVRDESRVDDLEQETWLAALRWPVPRSASPRRWLATILRRTAARGRLSDRRRSRRERSGARRERVPDTSSVVAAAEAQGQVVRAVLALDEPYRSTLLLRFFEDLPPREVARRMDAPLETVRARVRRGLARVRGTLEREHGAERWCAVLAPLLFVGPKPAAVALGGAAMWKVNAVLAAVALGTLGYFALRHSGSTQPERTEGWADADPARDRVESGGASGAGDRADRLRDEDRIARKETGTSSDLVVPFGRDQAGREQPEAESGTSGSGSGVDGNKSRKTKKQAVKVDTGRRDFSLGEGRGKWLPRPPKGTGTLVGTVVDRTGVPLAGAILYRLKEGVDHAETTIHHFGKMWKIGRTGKDGRFKIGGQVQGAFLLTADYKEYTLRPSPPYGLDTKHAIQVELSEGGTAANLLIKIPFSEAEDMGAVRGRVLDEDDKPMRVVLEMGAFVGRTDREGNFEFPKVLPGSYPLKVRHYGYRTFTGTVEVKKGEATELAVQLEIVDRGTLVIRGRVVDPEGNPVVERNVWLNDATERKSIRHARTDENGRYVFPKLPKRLKEHELEVQVGWNGRTRLLGERRPGVRLPSDNVDFVLERAALLNIQVLRADGEPPDEVRGQVFERRKTPAGTSLVAVRTFHTLPEGGLLKLLLRRGDYTVVVEAPGHKRFVQEESVVPQESDEPRVIEAKLEKE